MFSFSVMQSTFCFSNIIGGNIISDMSGHFSVFCLTSSLVVKGTPDRPHAREFSKFSEENFVHDLSRIDWVDIVSRNETNIDKVYSSYNKLNKLINKHAPSKPISRTHAIPCFAQSKILPITKLYFKLSSILMLDIRPLTLHLKISAIFLLLHKTYINIIPAKYLLVTTTLIILGSIIIKTLFPLLGLKFGTAFPKAIEDYQSTYSKRKFKHYYL